MIISADLHLRTTKPRNRIDDYWAAQEAKLRFILKQAQASPPLLVAGDFFDQPRPGERLLRWVIDLLNEHQIKPIMVPGQHDLPYHSLDKIGDSGLGVLEAAGMIKLLYDKGPESDWCVGINPDHDIDIGIYGFAYGQQPWKPEIQEEIMTILLWHHMVIQEPLWPGQEANKASAIIRKYPQFDIIVTGDNHTTFTIAGPNRRWLVNPGSMMRMTSAQADHKPCVFKWEAGRLEQIFLPCQPAKEVLDLEAMDQERQRDGRIGAFIERLHSGYEVGLSFEKNLEEYFRANDVDPVVQEEIWQAVG